METCDLQNNTSPFSFLVIFNSGDTLVISPSKEYVVGPIIPFKTMGTDGGKTGGIHIAGICPIRWSFMTCDKYLVVCSICYHVPYFKARLIISQRLFDKQKRADSAVRGLDVDSFKLLDLT